MKIKINNNEYEVKSNVKAMLVYEGITEKPFEIKSLTDFYTYCYAMVYANNTENVPQFDEFLNWFDDESVSEQFASIMNKPALEQSKKKTEKKEKK